MSKPIFWDDKIEQESPKLWELIEEPTKTTEATEEAKLLIMPGIVKGWNAKFLFDSGATGNYISQDLVKKAEIITKPTGETYKVSLADGTKHDINEAAYKLPYTIRAYPDKLDLEVIPLRNHDIILGKTWLEEKNPTIDWKKNQIQFKYGN